MTPQQEKLEAYRSFKRSVEAALPSLTSTTRRGRQNLQALREALRQLDQIEANYPDEEEKPVKLPPVGPGEAVPTEE